MCNHMLNDILECDISCCVIAMMVSIAEILEMFFRLLFQLVYQMRGGLRQLRINNNNAFPRKQEADRSPFFSEHTDVISQHPDLPARLTSNSRKRCFV